MMQKNKTHRKLLAAILALVMFLTLPGFTAFAVEAEPASEGTRVDILTFSDFHGMVDNLMNDNDPGAALMVAYAAWMREQNPNPDNVIVVPGGDDFHGHPLSNHLNGAPALAMMRQLGVEHMALGNHEFSFGLATTLELAEEITFLAADLFYAEGHERAGERPDFVEPYAIVEFEDGDITVGLIGLMTRGMEHLVAGAFMDDFDLRTPTHANADPAWISAIEDLIDELREDYGVDAVIAVTHMPAATEARDLAGLIDGFDAILGGHYHARITSYDTGTPIIEAGQHGRSLGRISLYFDAAGDLDDVTLFLNPVNSIRDFRDHEDFADFEEYYTAMAEIIQEYADEAEPYLGQVLGTRSIYSQSRDDRNVWATRLVLDYVARSTDETDWVYFSNFGGWRNVPPFEFAPDTEVTMRELYATMPFNNVILLYEMYGRELLTLLSMEPSTDTSQDPPTFGLNGGQPPVVAGAHRGAFLGYVEIEGVERPRWQWYVTSTGEPIRDDDTIYRVIGSNFTAGNAADRFPVPGNVWGDAMGQRVHAPPVALMADGSTMPWADVPADGTLWEAMGLRTLRSAMIEEQTWRSENPGYTSELIVRAEGEGAAAITAPFAPGDRTRNVNVNGTWVTLEATAAEGYAFAGWFVGNQEHVYVGHDERVSMSRVFSFAQTEDMVLEARFVPFPFVDVPEDVWDWARPYITFAYANQIMQGDGGGRFNPGGTFTRAMVAVTLWNAENRPEVEWSPVFSDIPETAADWYRTAVMWAYENNVMQGHGDGRFSPTEPITREQFAATLARYIDFEAPPEDFELNFPDAGQVSPWAVEYMRWANYHDLIRGTGAGLVPGGFTDRAQAATILARFIMPFTT